MAKIYFMNKKAVPWRYWALFPAKPKPEDRTKILSNLVIPAGTWSILNYLSQETGDSITSLAEDFLCKALTDYANDPNSIDDFAVKGNDDD